MFILLGREIPDVKAKMLFDLYSRDEAVGRIEFLNLFDELCLISINFIISMIGIKSLNNLVEYTERLLLCKELAQKRVLSEWFVSSEILSYDIFEERMVQYGFISTMGVRFFVSSSFSPLANVILGKTKIAKTLLEN